MDEMVGLKKMVGLVNSCERGKTRDWVTEGAARAAIGVRIVRIDPKPNTRNRICEREKSD